MSSTANPYQYFNYLSSTLGGVLLSIIIYVLVRVMGLSMDVVSNTAITTLWTLYWLSVILVSMSKGPLMMIVIDGVVALITWLLVNFNTMFFNGDGTY